MGSDHKTQHWVVQHCPEVVGGLMHWNSCPATVWQEHGLDKQTQDRFSIAVNACSWVLSLIKLLACFDLHFDKAKLLYLNHMQCTYSSCSSSKNRMSCILSGWYLWANSVQEALATPRARICSWTPGVVFYQCYTCKFKTQSHFYLQFSSTKAWTWMCGMKSG